MPSLQLTCLLSSLFLVSSLKLQAQPFDPASFQEKQGLAQGLANQSELLIRDFSSSDSKEAFPVTVPVFPWWIFGGGSRRRKSSSKGSDEAAPAPPPAPAPTPAPSKVIAVDGGSGHTLFLYENGTAYGVGQGSIGCLGHGANADVLTPVEVKLTGISTIATNGQYSLFIAQKGTNDRAFATGRNTNGQLGDGTTDDKNIPIEVPIPIGDVAAVAAGDWHSLFVLKNGSAYGVGYNFDGQIGDGTTVDKTTPVQVMTNVKAVAASRYNSLFLQNDGSLYSVGSGTKGKLGVGTLVSKTTPVRITTSAVKAICSNYEHSMYLLSNGAAFSWGANEYGETGDGTNTHTTAPKKVLDGVTQIACGVDHTMFLKADGTAWATGRNRRGQLGDGTNEDRNTPVKVNIADVVAIGAGQDHSMFVTADGSAWTVGWNLAGQLGDGTSGWNAWKTSPVKVMDPR